MTHLASAKFPFAIPNRGCQGSGLGGCCVGQDPTAFGRFGGESGWRHQRQQDEKSSESQAQCFGIVSHDVCPADIELIALILRN